MSYTLKLTNGTILLNLSDQKTDQLTTSLTLIGKNVPAYGTYFNENLIYLLENFASPTQPRSPLYGQLWYNSAQGRMYYYNNNNQFRPVGSPIVSPIQPTGSVPGDLWLDSTNKQLTVFDGTDFIPAGKSYSTPQGKAGWIVEQIIDSTNLPKTVSTLYNNGIVLAVLSEVAFTPATPYNGIPTIGVGLTLNNSLSGMRMIGTATNALSVAGISADKFIKNSGYQYTTGTWAILNGDGFLVQAPIINGDLTTGTSLRLSIGNILGDRNQDAIISASRIGNGGNIHSARLVFSADDTTNGTVVGMTIDPFTKSINFLPNVINGAVNVTGDVNITGNLNVIGTGTNVQVKNLEVDNIKIELAYPPNSLPDAAIDGGGVVLHGTIDHSLTYKNSLVGWASSDNFTVAYNKGYYITNQAGNDIKVLDAGNLYVSNAPNLTAIGSLGNLTVGNIFINTSTISTVDGVSDLVLNKTGVGNVSLGGKKIIKSGTITQNDSTQTLVTKYYVDNLQVLKNSIVFVFSLDVTQVTDVNLFAIDFISRMIPVGAPGSFYNIPEQARCRVNCMNYAIPSWSQDGVSNYAVTAVDQNGIKNAVNVLTGVTVRTTSPVVYPSCTQQIREYIVAGGQWVFSTIIG
jgi:hypothetical protein